MDLHVHTEGRRSCKILVGVCKTCRCIYFSYTPTSFFTRGVHEIYTPPIEQSDWSKVTSHGTSTFTYSYILYCDVSLSLSISLSHTHTLPPCSSDTDAAVDPCKCDRRGSD